MNNKKRSQAHTRKSDKVTKKKPYRRTAYLPKSTISSVKATCWGNLRELRRRNPALAKQVSEYDLYRALRGEGVRPEVAEAIENHALTTT